MSDNKKADQPNEMSVSSADTGRTLQFNKPRMLTKSEIESLRQDKVQAHNQARKILAKMKVPRL